MMPILTNDRHARLWKRSLPDGFSSGAIPAILRNVKIEDIPALGDLLYAAFLDTIDDGGLTKSQYTSKASAILGGRYGEWLPEASWTIEQMGGLRSACLVSDYKPYGCPVIALVATTPCHQRSGDGGILLDAVLASLTALGHPECCAMVTVGNVASERLFQSRGFLPQPEN